MARRTTDGKIPDLGERIAFLEGILGHRRAPGDFLNEKLGEIVGSERVNFGRMRQGEAAISNKQLADLIDFFELGGPHIDYRVFRAPFEEFERTMRENGVGTFAGVPLDVACTGLIALARRPDAPKLAVSLRRLNAVRRGGLGLPCEPLDPAVSLFLDDKADIKITPPAKGHLVILSHHLGIDLTCLMPSIMAPDTKVGPRALAVPSSPEYEHFRVRGPCGRHRIFAVWSEKEIPRPWETENETDDRLTEVSGAHADRFVSSLSKLKVGTTAVAYRDYVVQSKGG